MTECEVLIERTRCGVKYCKSCKTLHLIEDRCSNEQNRVKSRCRNILYHSVKGLSSGKHMKKLTGVALNEFKSYIESLFRRGMSWDNYGEWHLDHIRPCSWFDLEDINEVLKCYNYKKTQPLWAKENKSKGDRTENYRPKQYT